ncbi:MAG: hypothetical protein ABI707_10905 [Ferruginibacter sp.]
MTKKIISFILLMAIFQCIKAQKGNNGLSFNGEATIPIFQNDQGFGFFIKGLYGIGSSAQLTVSGGVSIFNNKNIIERGEITTRLIPFLVGYNQYIHHFFIEPQIGLGELGGRIKIEGDYARPSVAAIFGAVATGYTFKQISAGIRFQTAHGIENNSAGLWHDQNFHYTSVFIGYNIFSKRARE